MRRDNSFFFYFLFSGAVIFNFIFSGVIAQDTTNGISNSLSVPGVMLIPYDPLYYLSDADHDIAEQSNVGMIDVRKTFHEKVDYYTYAALSKNFNNTSLTAAPMPTNEMFPIRLELNVRWYSFYNDCLPGIWYCWIIGENVMSTKDYIYINTKLKQVTYGIDNNINTEYHKKFIQGSYFNFPEDSYINPSVVKACIGIEKAIFTKKGIYPMTIVDGVLTITTPYQIAN